MATNGPAPTSAVLMSVVAAVRCDCLTSEGLLAIAIANAIQPVERGKHGSVTRGGSEFPLQAKCSVSWGGKAGKWWNTYNWRRCYYVLVKGVFVRHLQPVASFFAYTPVGDQSCQSPVYKRWFSSHSLSDRYFPLMEATALRDSQQGSISISACLTTCLWPSSCLSDYLSVAVPLPVWLPVCGLPLACLTTCLLPSPRLSFSCVLGPLAPRIWTKCFWANGWLPR